MEVGDGVGATVEVGMEVGEEGVGMEVGEGVEEGVGMGVEVVNPLTLRGALETIVCYSHTFENNLGIKRKFTKYLKESCSMASDQHLSFKFLQQNAFVSKIFPKSSGLFGHPEC